MDKFYWIDTVVTVKKRRIFKPDEMKYRYYLREGDSRLVTIFEDEDDAKMIMRLLNSGALKEGEYHHED